jgi:site-specific DNA-cytosine methylase
VLDLFSGIGSFSLGLELAGFQTAAFCEIDPFCRKILERHWPGVKIHDDVKQLDGSQYERSIDVVCGGYPCQPFSVAGNQRAEADPRHLWPEMLRIIRGSRPRWVICENVSGHVKLGFDTVAAQLEAEGFAVWPFLIPASAVGGIHPRERLWLVCHAEHHGLPTSTLAGGFAEAAERDTQGAIQAGEPQRAGEPLDGRAMGDGCHTELACPDWSLEPTFCGMADGLASELDKSRIRAIGNTLVPAIPRLIGQTIIRYERHLVRAA